MASPRTKKAFNIMTEKLANKEPVTMGEVLREAGFAVSTSLKPKLVTNTKGWQELLATIDNEPLLDRMVEIALGADKRVGLEAIKTILIDIKGLGSEKSAKVIGLFEKVGELQIKEEIKEEDKDDKSKPAAAENQLPSTSGTAEGSKLPE